MVRLIAAFVVMAFVAISAHAGELQGQWQGTWTKAGDALPVTVSFEKLGSAHTGTFDSDALQVSGIPFREVTVNGNKVHFVLGGDATTTTFDGAFTGSDLTGTFSESSNSGGGAPTPGTFNLKRASIPPLRTREVTFANGAVTLSGELVLPTAQGRRPAIVFLHGSGAEGRWASRYLASKFARAGFVALVFDKRGVGKSTGDWQKSTFDDLAADAAAGIRFLAEQREVDAGRIGIYGHSQGGTISPLVAQRSSLAFVIASAAAGLDPAEVEVYSIGNSIGVPALKGKEKADAERFVREIVAVAYHGKNRKALDAMIVDYKDRAWFFTPPAPDHSYWTLSRSIALYRPLDHWRKVAAPVLLVYGAHDERVPPEKSAAAIAAALKKSGNGMVTLKTFPTASHTFHIVPQDPKGGWPKRVSDYADTLTAWAAALN